MNEQIIEAEVIKPTPEVITGVTESGEKKASVIKWLKLAGVLLLVLAIVGITLTIMNAIKTYKNAQKYKKSYDIVQEQIDYCDKIKNEEVRPVVVHYCDEFDARFNTIEKQ